MRFEELNWFDIEKYLTVDDRLIIIIGACEQHGYLSQTTDVLIPQALADAASQRTGVLVAPSVNFGSSPYFLDYPGTLSLRLSTLMNLLEDIIRSAQSQGFQRILVLNGHGGNDGVRSRLYELANQLAGLKIAWYAWWQSHSVQAIAEKHELKPAHANWLEAFPFTTVSDIPKEEKIPPRVDGILNAREAKQIYGDGVFGGAYQSDPSIMDEIFSAAVEDILQMLKFES
jgi:creatinine amidohydrolase